MNYKITVQYDGSRYDGWQKQGNTENTIQYKLENILERFLGYHVDIHGAGRTDAGVHAEAQVANFKITPSLPADEIKSYFNHYLPEDIAVINVEEADERFHARLSAKGKIYRYDILNDSVPDVFNRKFHYRIEEKLDVDAMKCAAEMLTGTHDFRSFCSNKKYKKSTVRTVYSIEISKRGNNISILFHGNGFLYNMVRIISGTLIEVGLGERDAQDIPRILTALDRQYAGKTAPAQGLTLVKVEY